ncbi:MAG: RHS repeat domain-containing protein [Brevundimonas sp.]|uniref:RHS repeat domain-containing protein n=1 Tax=Brevundimonas sp. TaxID=1871086 RepID=UPI0027369423|nr:RHS repeat domain-containing protein [Brevundimonas sp.]MDP3377253.1 RHS repeat domain-containing protein [Brevundimonas sp.]
MTISRRTIMASLALSAPLSFLGRLTARADPINYTYDALGRLHRVEYSTGCTIEYTYDAAGNRTLLSQTSCPPAPPPPPPPPPTPFTQTIQITGTAPVNLRSLANTAGYDGTRDATVTFELGSGVTITGAAAGGLAIDSGTWPTGSYAIALSLVVKTGANVRGGGGSGGAGGGDFSGMGEPGGPGGDAIYCRLPMTVTVQSGAAVQAGGGGGAGGNPAIDWPSETIAGGGGGGGGRPNGAGGPAGSSQGGSGTNAAAGSAGTTSAAGNGGSGAERNFFGGTLWGDAGGGGGNYGAAGSSVWSGASGGVAGYAIRKNGHTVTVTNSGTITGTVG